MVNFSAIWKDSGFLEATPPFLVIPYDGIGLAYLNGVRSLNMVDDLKFDRTNLSVTAVNANDISMYLVQYSQNFPSTVRADVFGLGGGIRNVTHFGRTVLLAIEGTVASVTASVDYVKSAGRAKMDVYTAKRKTVAASFRFIRYLNDAKEMKSGTVLAPPYAEELVRVLNRLFMPSANIVNGG